MKREGDIVSTVYYGQPLRIGTIGRPGFFTTLICAISPIIVGIVGLFLMNTSGYESQDELSVLGKPRIRVPNRYMGLRQEYVSGGFRPSQTDVHVCSNWAPFDPENATYIPLGLPENCKYQAFVGVDGDWNFKVRFGKLREDLEDGATATTPQLSLFVPLLFSVPEAGRNIFQGLLQVKATGSNLTCAGVEGDLLLDQIGDVVDDTSAILPNVTIAELSLINRASVSQFAEAYEGESVRVTFHVRNQGVCQTADASDGYVYLHVKAAVPPVVLRVKAGFWYSLKRVYVSWFYWTVLFGAIWYVLLGLAIEKGLLVTSIEHVVSKTKRD